MALKLTNVTVENKRVEDYQCPGQIDIVISRAFASLGRLVQLSRAVTGGHGVLLAMKGNYPDQEIAELPAGFNVSRAIELKVPGVDESRYLIEVPLKEIALKKSRYRMAINRVDTRYTSGHDRRTAEPSGSVFTPDSIR